MPSHLLFIVGVGKLALPRQRQAHSDLFSSVNFTQQEARNDRRFNFALYCADIRLIILRGLDDVLLQLIVALHVQQAEDHVQLVHKLMRMGAQGINVADHAINTLH